MAGSHTAGAPPRKRKLRRRRAVATGVSEAAEVRAAEQAALEQVEPKQMSSVTGHVRADGAERPPEGGDEDNEMQMEFEFCDPNELDYHGVATQLKNGTWDFVDGLNYSELADSVVGQGNIGSVIKSGDEDEDGTIYGLLTALNLRQFKQLSWPGHIEKALLAKASRYADADTTSALESLILQQGSGAEVGLLLGERLVNLPNELVPPLHRALKDDIAWSCTTPECPADERPFYLFTHFLRVARCDWTPLAFSAASEAAATPSSSSTLPSLATSAEVARKKKKRRLAEGAHSNGVAGGFGPSFAYQEDEIYFRRASISFTFPIPPSSSSRSSKESRAQERRAVYVLTRKAFEGGQKDLRVALLGGDG